MSNYLLGEKAGEEWPGHMEDQKNLWMRNLGAWNGLVDWELGCKVKRGEDESKKSREVICYFEFCAS